MQSKKFYYNERVAFGTRTRIKKLECRWFSTNSEKTHTPKMSSVLLELSIGSSNHRVRGMVAPDGTERFSVYDVLTKIICDIEDINEHKKNSASARARQYYSSLVSEASKYRDKILSDVVYLKFTSLGQGQRDTPTMTVAGLHSLVSRLGGKISKAFRDETLQVLERYLDGDTTMCREIEENLSMGKTKSYAKFAQKVMERAEINKAEACLQMPQTAYVYATKSDAFPGLIKIGRTVDVAKRIASFNTACAPAPHMVVALAPTFDYARDEKAAHDFFAQVRKEGEFFQVSEAEVIAYFTGITSAYHTEFAMHSSCIVGRQIVVEEIEYNSPNTVSVEPMVFPSILMAYS